MKTLLMLPVFILTAVCDGMVTSDLPRPWLSLDRTATVLHLCCRPPSEAFRFNSWQAVLDLRLYAFLPQHSPFGNVSLVNMTSDLKKPRVNPNLSISQASFQGDWDSKSVSLDFVFPVTDKELGHYFCIVDYMDNNDKILKFATRVLVDKDFVFSHTETTPKTVQNFEVRVEEVHKVHVTWTKPKHSKFTEASVSYGLMGYGEKSISTSRSLFSTSGDADLVYGSQVLLKKLNNQDSGNMSITLYVKKDQHSVNYRYSCWVPYPACTGEKAVLCMCCQQGGNPDRQMCSISPDSQTVYIPSVLFLVLFSVTFPILIVVVGMYVLFKTRKFPKDSWLQKFFTQKRQSTPEKLPRGLPSFAVVPSSGLTKEAIPQPIKHPQVLSPRTGVNQEETHPLVGSQQPAGGDEDESNNVAVQSKTSETSTPTVVSLPPKGTRNSVTHWDPNTNIPPRQQNGGQSHGDIPLQESTATCEEEDDEDARSNLEEEEEDTDSSFSLVEDRDKTQVNQSKVSFATRHSSAPVHLQRVASPPPPCGRPRHLSEPTSDSEYDIRCSNRRAYSSSYNPQQLIHASQGKQGAGV